MAYQAPDIIRRLFTLGQPISAAKGEIILGNDPIPDGVYFINSGYVKIYTISNDGDIYVHIIYGPGELFPLTWAFLGTHTEALFYEAMTDCVVWRMSKDRLNDITQSNPKICYELCVRLARQFRAFSDRVDNLEYKKASERVAYRLLFLAGRFGKKSNRGVTINVPLTHELFASSINLTRESVSRHFEHLERQGIIKKTGQYILIIDIQKLENQLNRPINLKNWNL